MFRRQGGFSRVVSRWCGVRLRAAYHLCSAYRALGGIEVCRNDLRISYASSTMVHSRASLNHRLMSGRSIINTHHEFLEPTAGQNRYNVYTPPVELTISPGGKLPTKHICGTATYSSSRAVRPPKIPSVRVVRALSFSLLFSGVEGWNTTNTAETTS